MKPIIATTLSGLFIKSKPWKEAHNLWFEQMVKETGDESLRQWVGKANYFEGVNLAMSKLMPDASREERTREARRRFMQTVTDYIKEHNDDVINRKIVEYFKSLKDRFRLALITTNTAKFLNEILEETGLDELFDIVECSSSVEEDDKIAVFERFFEKYGKPVVYFGGKRRDTYDYCRERNIFCVFANLENAEGISVRTVKNIDEIKQVIQELSS